MKNKKFIVLYGILTFLEFVGIGVLLFQARSLTTGGYSLPRLILLFFWFVGFGVFVWTSHSFIRNKTISQSINAFVLERYFLLKDSFLFFGILIWGVVILYYFQYDFWGYVSNFLPALLDQYEAVIVLVGIWLTQSLIFLLLIPSKARITNKTLFRFAYIFVLALFVYTYTAFELNLAPTQSTAYFPDLAQSFLNGRLDLVDPPATKDLTVFEGKYYVSFPPLGALLLMPIVALQGVEDVNMILFNSVFAALSVLFMFLALEAMQEIGLSKLGTWEHAALALFMGFGTAQYSTALRALVNFTSHVLTVAFLTLSFWLVIKLRFTPVASALLTGISIGLAMLARPNIVFAWIFIAILYWHILKNDNVFSNSSYYQWLFLSLLPVALAVVLMFWYNQARFGSPFDFGYSNMLVAKILSNDLITYGQFNVHFVKRNLVDNFLRIPYWDEVCQMYIFSPQGTSILFTSPLLIYLFKSFGRKGERWLQSAWLFVGLTILLHSMYYSSGSVQVGYRFSLDFMPVAVMMLAYGFGKRLPWIAFVLILYSMVINYYGVLWITHRLCENF
jgi:hypothetical protein